MAALVDRFGAEVFGIAGAARPVEVPAGLAAHLAKALGHPVEEAWQLSALPLRKGLRAG
ncbi:MAG: hypothetical protein M3400_15265 [Actinomycetota bacterium]|nr:hypothetical protein [Actinomycetota bacterium]